MEGGHSFRVPKGSKEVHPRYKDGLCWAQEGEGPQRHYHVFEGSGKYDHEGLCNTDFYRHSKNNMQKI